jgi:lysophospholipase L1-like esterase
MKKIALLLTLTFVILSFTARKITWVAIGDSITYLNEHQDETGNRISKGYMTKVVEKLTAISYINQGHNGWTSGDIADKIESLGLVKADVYTIFLGTNDWWRGRNIGSLSDYQNNKGNSTVYGSFRIIINKLKQLNSGAKIILLTPMQRSDFVYINNMKNNAWGSYKEKNGQKLSDFAEAIKEIGKYEKIPVIDLYNEPKMMVQNLVKFKRLKDPQTGVYRNYKYPDYIDVPFNPQTDEYPYPTGAIDITYDGLHPSDKGNEIIASKIVKVMKRLEF